MPSNILLFYTPQILGFPSKLVETLHKKYYL